MYLVSRLGVQALWTPFVSTATVDSSLSGLKPPAPKTALGALPSRSLFQVCRIPTTNTGTIFGYVSFRAMGRRISVAAAPRFEDPTCVFPVQVRDLISSRTRGRQAAEAAAHVTVSGLISSLFHRFRCRRVSSLPPSPVGSSDHLRRGRLRLTCRKSMNPRRK